MPGLSSSEGIVLGQLSFFMFHLDFANTSDRELYFTSRRRKFQAVADQINDDLQDPVLISPKIYIS